MEATLKDTATSRDLRSRLEALRAGVPHGHIAVCLWQAERGTAFAATSGDSAADRTLPCGCLTKLFTAALLEQAVADGLLELDMHLGHCLPAAHSATALAATTLRELLEHRHGLDDSLLAAVPRHAAGTIDADRLVASLDGRLFESGTLYSYSNAGAWLCAALLEALRGKPYAALLTAWAAARGIGVRAQSRAVCPALGHGLSVSVAGLMSFARRLVTDGPRWASASPARLPGWHPLERGIDRGFKHYGGGWFGHQSAEPRASAWLCVHPSRRIAIVVESGKYSAAVVALRLFARQLPGFVSTLPPQPARGHCAVSPPRGGYASRARCWVVSIPGHGPASASLRCGSHTAILRPSRHGIFNLDPPEAQTPFVQFVRAADGTGPYLWNGRQIFTRIAD